MQKGLSFLVPFMVMLSLSSSAALAAQESELQQNKHERKLAIDEKNITKHSTKVNGQKFKYTAD